MTTATLSDYRDPEEPADWHDMPAEPPIEERLLAKLGAMIDHLCLWEARWPSEQDAKARSFTIVDDLQDYLKQAIADRNRDWHDPECADPFAEE